MKLLQMTPETVLKLWCGGKEGSEGSHVDILVEALPAALPRSGEAGLHELVVHGRARHQHHEAQHLRADQGLGLGAGLREGLRLD